MINIKTIRVKNKEGIENFLKKGAQNAIIIDNKNILLELIDKVDRSQVYSFNKDMTNNFNLKKGNIISNTLIMDSFIKDILSSKNFSRNELIIFENKSENLIQNLEDLLNLSRATGVKLIFF